MITRHTQGLLGLAWVAMAIVIAVAWLLEPNVRIIGMTAGYVAVSWAVLSRLHGKWFILACALMGCGLALVFGDELQRLRSLGWMAYTILLLLLGCILSVRFRRILLATDSMRTALFGYWISRRQVAKQSR